ncbi:MAG TPA: hypothetical protein VKN14_03315 [Flavobacteriaceae bacterium]|nr:hypothetical protein [Flavobacteriaceae bacterium]
MKFLLKSISYIFHPLLMPLVAVGFYYLKSPRYIPTQIIQAKIISVIILTLILPILLFFLLKTLKKVKSIHLKTTQERIRPLIIFSIIIFLVLRKIFPQNDIVELYYFFIGVLITNLSCLFMAFFKFKASLHLAGISGVLMFFVALSIHYNININGTLALLSIIIGLIATSRLYLNAHNYKELAIGFFIGFLPQLIVINYWL